MTNKVINTLAEAGELIDWYRARWEIEIFFDILKNAGKIENLKLKSMHKLEVAIALNTIVTWRINRLMRLERECSELTSSLVFEPDEWMVAYILNEKAPQKKVSTANELVRLIVSLDEFLERKGDGDPSVETIWQGMERVASFAAGMKFARQMENSTSFVCNDMSWFRCRCTSQMHSLRISANYLEADSTTEHKKTS